MSLLERVNNSSKVLEEGKLADNCVSVYELKQDIAPYTSLETIASMLVKSKERARAELVSACKQAFTNDKYGHLSPSEKESLVSELIDVVFGMGPIEALIEDESVTEIMINGAKSVYYERDGKLHSSGIVFENDEQVRVLIDRIVGPLGRRIDESSPLVNARLPQGHRVNAVISPIAIHGPYVTIRGFTRHVMTLEEMIETGSLDYTLLIFLEWLVKLRKNVVVAGGTGSGKTTLLNAISCKIDEGERIITIEDAAELKFKEGLHVVSLEARPINSEGKGEVTIRELVQNALRMRPDRIIVGECRGGEALDMLQAMNTGHDGSLTTLHANSSLDVIDRMVTLVRYAIDLPLSAIKAQIGTAFDYIIYLSRARDGRRFISEVSQVSYSRENEDVAICQLYVADRPNSGKWVEVPKLIQEALEQNIASEVEVDEWRQVACL